MSPETAAFHFLRPWWLLALLPLAGVLWRWWRQPPMDNPWPRWVDAALLSHLLLPTGNRHHRLPYLMLATLWLLTVVALAGPSWRQAPAPLFRPAAPPLVILLDISRSMQAVDIPPSRLEAAKAKLHTLLERLPPRRLALIAYGPEAYPVMPLTRDHRLVVDLLEGLDSTLLPAQGSNGADAIRAGLSAIRRSRESAGDLLMVTDSVDEAAAKAAAQARAAELRLVVYGLGTVEGGPIPLDDGEVVTDAGKAVIPRLDAVALQAAAQAGGGQLIRYTADGEDITALLEAVARPAHRTQERLAQQSPIWHDEGPWLLLLILPLAALMFRRNWLFVIPLVATLQPQPAEAMQWRELWLNSDQRALALLQEGEAAQAARLFKAPLWRGIAHYRAGDYAAAAEAFAQVDTALGHYNRGNALAHLNRLTEALNAYREALARNPRLREAEENRQRIQRLLATPPAKKPPASPRKREGKAPPGKRRITPSKKTPSVPVPRMDAEPTTPQQKRQKKGLGGNIQAPARETEDDKRGSGKQPPSATTAPASKRPSRSTKTPASGAQQASPSTRQSKPADEAEKATLDKVPPTTMPPTPVKPRQEEAEPSSTQGAVTTPSPDTSPRRTTPNAASAEEHRQAVEQWLTRIQEDPSPFLKELFRRRHERAATPWEGPPW